LFLAVGLLAGCGGGSGETTNYEISTNSGPGGTISPTSVTVASGSSTSLTVTPDAGFDIGSVSGCGGSLSGSTYTIDNVNADCTVIATFIDVLFTVSTNASSGGSINPSSTDVNLNDTTSFSITPDSGFAIESASGCSGTLSGTTYTTGSISSDCTVSVTFADNSVITHDVNASAGTGGSITPSFASVQNGNTTSFTITPNTGFSINSVSGCDGILIGNTYTTGVITVDCDVQVTFTALSAPTVNAGNDQTVQEKTNITLTSTASDTGGSIQSYSWTQLSGTTVTINNADSASMNFEAPEINTAEVLVFQVTVTDNDSLTASDTVEITVVNASPVNVIAATGMPAVDFPNGYIYWSVFRPSIGDSGHVAYLGVADVSISSTDQNTNALWSGLPSDIKLIIKENDTLPGLPSNVLFEGLSGPSTPIVSASGHVAHLVNLKGAVTNANDSALIVYANNSLQTVIREGAPAPGFPAGYIMGSISHYVFSDAGLVFLASTRDTTTNRMITGMWYWDFNGFTLVAAFDFLEDIVLTEESPDIFANDCQFFMTPVLSPKINNNGEIAFTALLQNDSGVNCPNNYTLLKWKDGNYTALISAESPVPGLTGHTFSLDTLFSKFDLEDDGDVSLYTNIKNGSDIRSINWVIKNSGDHEYLSIGEETLPDDPSATMFKNLFGVSAAPMADNQGNYLVSTLTTGNGEIYLLKGASQTLPYSSITEIGTSQLTKVVRQTDVPTDYPSTEFFSSIGIEDPKEAPTINSSGDIVFKASRANALTPQVETPGIWHASAAGQLKMLVEVGDEISVNGTTDTVTFVGFDRVGALGSGNYSEHSNTGQIILPAQLNNTYNAILLITP